MSIYATATIAGSAGKTTSVTSLAVLCASRGASVRVIDFDPQGNASRQLGYADLDENELTVADVLAEAATIADVERPALAPAGISEEGLPIFDDESDIENLTVVPAYFPTLDEMKERLGHITGGVTRLRRAISAAPPVDVTLIDAPGVKGALTLSAILATQADQTNGASGVLTCTLPKPKEIEGIGKLENLIAAVNEDRDLAIALKGIIVCDVPTNKRKLYQESVADLREGYGDLVAPSIGQAVGVPEAYSFYTPVPLFRNARKTTLEYIKVLDHFIAVGLFPEVKAS